MLKEKELATAAKAEEWEPPGHISDVFYQPWAVFTFAKASKFVARFGFISPEHHHLPPIFPKERIVGELTEEEKTILTLLIRYQEYYSNLAGDDEKTIAKKEYLLCQLKNLDALLGRSMLGRLGHTFQDQENSITYRAGFKVVVFNRHEVNFTRQKNKDGGRYYALSSCTFCPPKSH